MKTMTNPAAIEISPEVAVRLSGTGGQGLLLAGKILAEAAAIYDGLSVVQTNSYGPEARGGASRSEVVISRDEVDDLKSSSFDILICLSQQACDAYYGGLKEGGVLIVDSTNVSVVPTSRAIELPMTRMAVEECGSKLLANTIALGVLCGYTSVVTFDALNSAIASSLRADLVAVNAKALKMGYDAAMAILKALPERRQVDTRSYSLARPQLSEEKAAPRRGRSKPSERTAVQPSMRAAYHTAVYARMHRR